MSVPQTGSMQAATLRCPPNVFRERYSLADFEATHTYGEGPNWSICAARCKWSSAQVVLQTYTEVGNLSGCMAMALTAAHSLTNHPSFLPLYAVFRDVGPAGAPPPAPADSNGVGAASTSGSSGGGGAAANGGSGGGAGRGDRVVMVYPGGSAQHPLDMGTPTTSSSSSSSSGGGSGSGGSGCSYSASSLSPPGSSGGGGSGPPVSERGVVRGLLQPLSDLVAVLSSMGLRPSYVCGLDVWLDSPEAPGPGQALFMVPLMCQRRGHSPPEELLPAAVPYAAPYLRANPAAAGDQDVTDEAQAKRWLSWSAAALVHVVLIGSPPPDKDRAVHRKSRGKLPSIASPPPSVPQLPPLLSNGGLAARHSMMMVGPGMPRHSGLLVLPSGHNGNGLGSSGFGGGDAGSGGGGGGGALTKRVSGSRPVDPRAGWPLWLSDEAGDWFRRGLEPDCSSRTPLDEQMRHPWVSRHAVPRNVGKGQSLRRESLGFLPRDLHPLLLDLVPMGLARPGRGEVESLMAEIAASEAPSAAKPALPWQIVEGPQPGAAQPQEVVVVVEEFSVPEEIAGAAAAGGAAAAEDDRDTSVIERYEVAELQHDDGTRVVEELRIVSGKPDGALSRAAKALQAAMARRGEAAGQWVMANPRGTTFDDIARQNQHHRQQMPPSLPVPPRRISNGAPASPSLAARRRSPDPILPATASASSPAPLPAPAPGGRNRSPNPRASRAHGGTKAGKAAR